MDRTISIQYQEKLFKLILAFRENRYCADCHSLNPDWASTTLGVFICYKCSGIHRSFGIHITRVKSTTLDTWTVRQVYIIGLIDNNVSNAYWEANLPEGFVKPTCDSAPNDLVNYARRKYIERAFAVPGRVSPAEEMQSDLIAAAGKSEDKEEFFKTKLSELKKVLKSKALATSPDKIQKMRKHTKKPAMLVIQSSAERFSKTNSNVYDSPDKTQVKALVSPLVPPNNKSGRSPYKGVGSQTVLPSSAQLPLFRGLILKTQTTIGEPSEEKTDYRSPPSLGFFKSDPQQAKPWRNSDLTRSIGPSSGTSSKNNIMTLPSKRRIIDYLEEDRIFEESKGPSPKGSLEEIEMQDMSSISSAEGNKGPLLTHDMKQQNQEIRLNSLSSITSIMCKRKPRDEGHHEAHLKRPSEAFEVPRCLSIPELPPTRLKRSDQLWKYPVILVCFALHMVMGYIYSWGSISPYIASFIMSDYQDDRYTEHTSYNMMLFLGFAVGFCLCEKVTNAIGMRLMVLCSLLGLGVSMFICSLTQDILLYSGMLTLVAGFFIGLLYEIPFCCAVQYFYLYPNFLKGFFYFANGIGAFIYIYFSYYYLSQRDFAGELEAPAQGTSSFYSYSIVSNIPRLLSIFSTGIIIMGIVGGILLHPISSFIVKDYSGIRDREESLLLISRRSSTRGRRRKATAIIHQGLKEALTSPNTKNLMSLILFSSILGSYILCSYKYLGLLHNLSDETMTLIGGAGVIMLNIGKVLGVIIHPKYEFKVMFSKVLTSQIVAGITLFLLGQVFDEAFLLFSLVIMFLDGLIFSLLIEETKFVHLEDIEDAMVALIVLGYAVANFISFIILKPLVLLELRSAIIFILTLPLFLAYRTCKNYSRATIGDNSRMISELLSVE